MKIKEIVSLLIVALLSSSFISCKDKEPKVQLRVEQQKQEITPKDKGDDDKTEEYIKHIDTKTFREKVYDYNETGKNALKTKRPVVVDFYATWCGPCKQLAPRFEAMAKKYHKEIDFYKVNVDKEPQLSRAFGIRSIPYLLYIPLKDRVFNSIGLVTIEQLEENINYLKENS